MELTSFLAQPERPHHPELGAGITPCGPPGGVAIVGEAPGANEQAYGKPFVGSSGKELQSMLAEAGINFEECYLTHVFKFRPPKNDVSYFFTSRAEAGMGAQLPPLAAGKYIRTEWLPSISDLLRELHAVQPRLVIALGNTALWALTRHAGISKHRGVIRELKLSPSGAEPWTCNLLPTFHPASVVRQWNQRPICVADLSKAVGSLGSADAVETHVEYAPTRQDLKEWGREILSAQMLAVDIETLAGQITMIGFATSPQRAYVVPFWLSDLPKGHYWPTAQDEAAALAYVEEWLQSPIPKVFQNGLYDIQYIWKIWGFAPRRVLHDTMLKHHSIQPEMQKSLGFLGSLYLNRPAWKTWSERRSTKKKEEKKDD